MGHGLRWRLDLSGACFTTIFCVAEASECVGVCVCASLVADTTWRGVHRVYLQHELAFGCGVLMVPCTPSLADLQYHNNNNNNTNDNTNNNICNSNGGRDTYYRGLRLASACPITMACSPFASSSSSWIGAWEASPYPWG